MQLKKVMKFGLKTGPGLEFARGRYVERHLYQSGALDED